MCQAVCSLNSHQASLSLIIGSAWIGGLCSQHCQRPIALQPLLSSLSEALLACSIWKDAQVQQELYRYYKPETRGLDQEGLLEDLSKGSPGDVVLLHACAHNPTGAE